MSDFERFVAGMLGQAASQAIQRAVPPPLPAPPPVPAGPAGLPPQLMAAIAAAGVMPDLSQQAAPPPVSGGRQGFMAPDQPPPPPAPYQTNINGQLVGTPTPSPAGAPAPPSAQPAAYQTVSYDAGDGRGTQIFVVPVDRMPQQVPKGVLLIGPQVSADKVEKSAQPGQYLAAQPANVQALFPTPQAAQASTQAAATGPIEPKDVAPFPSNLIQTPAAPYPIPPRETAPYQTNLGGQLTGDAPVIEPKDVAPFPSTLIQTPPAPIAPAPATPPAAPTPGETPQTTYGPNPDVTAYQTVSYDAGDGRGPQIFLVPVERMPKQLPQGAQLLGTPVTPDKVTTAQPGQFLDAQPAAVQALFPTPTTAQIQANNAQTEQARIAASTPNATVPTYDKNGRVVATPRDQAGKSQVPGSQGMVYGPEDLIMRNQPPPAPGSLPPTTPSDVAAVSPANAALLQKNGIVEIPDGQMAVRQGDNVTLYPAGATLPTGAQIIAYGGKTAKPTPPGAFDIVGSISGIPIPRAVEEGLGLLSKPLHESQSIMGDIVHLVTQDANGNPLVDLSNEGRAVMNTVFRDTPLGWVYTQLLGKPGAPLTQAISLGRGKDGLDATFGQFIQQVNTAYETGYNGYKGGRGVWELFQSTQPGPLKMIWDLLFDPLNYLPGGGFLTAGEKASQAIRGTEELIPLWRDVLAEGVTAGSRILGAPEKGAEIIGGLLGKGAEAVKQIPGVGTLLDKTTQTKMGREGTELLGRLNDFVNQTRRDVTEQAPPPAAALPNGSAPIPPSAAEGPAPVPVEAAVPNEPVPAQAALPNEPPPAEAVPAPEARPVEQLADNVRRTVQADGSRVVELRQPDGTWREIAREGGPAVPQTPAPQEPVVVGGPTPANPFQGTALDQARLAEAPDHWGFLSPQKTDNRVITEAARLGQQYPDKWAQFVAEHDAKARAFIKSQRSGRYADNALAEANYVINDLSPDFLRTFGDVAPLPAYQWHYRPGVEAGANARNFMTANREVVVERAIFEPDAQTAQAAQDAIKRRGFKLDEGGDIAMTASGKPMVKDGQLAAVYDQIQPTRDRYLALRQSRPVFENTPLAVTQAVTSPEAVPVGETPQPSQAPQAPLQPAAPIPPVEQAETVTGPVTPPPVAPGQPLPEFQRMPLDRITTTRAQGITGAGDFQMRKTDYAEPTVQNIVENYNPQKFQPIEVTPPGPDGTVTVLSGHSRYEAAQRLGLPDVPVKIITGDQRQLLEQALTSNTSGTALTPTERGLNIRRQMDELGKDIRQVASDEKITRSTAERYVATTHLPDDLQQLVDGGQLDLNTGAVLGGAVNDGTLSAAEAQNFYREQVLPEKYSASQTNDVLTIMRQMKDAAGVQQGGLFDGLDLGSTGAADAFAKINDLARLRRQIGRQASVLERAGKLAPPSTEQTALLTDLRSQQADIERQLGIGAPAPVPEPVVAAPATPATETPPATADLTPTRFHDQAKGAPEPTRYERMFRETARNGDQVYIYHPVTSDPPGQIIWTTATDASGPVTMSQGLLDLPAWQYSAPAKRLAGGRGRTFAQAQRSIGDTAPIVEHTLSPTERLAEIDAQLAALEPRVRRLSRDQLTGGRVGSEANFAFAEERTQLRALQDERARLTTVQTPGGPQGAMDLGAANRPVMQTGGATPGEAVTANDLLQPPELTPEQIAQRQRAAGQSDLFGIGGPDVNAAADRPVFARLFPDIPETGRQYAAGVKELGRLASTPVPNPAFAEAAAREPLTRSVGPVVTIRGRVLGNVEGEQLTRRFADGSTVLEQWDRRATELETGGMSTAEAEKDAAGQVANEFLAEHLKEIDPKAYATYEQHFGRLTSGSNAMEVPEARLVALMKASARNRNIYDESTAVLREGILYNSLTGWRYVATQGVGNTVTAILTRKFGMIGEMLNPGQLRSIYQTLTKQVPPELLDIEATRIASDLGLAGLKRDVFETGREEGVNLLGATHTQKLADRLRLGKTPVGKVLSQLYANPWVRDMANSFDVSSRVSLWGQEVLDRLPQARADLLDAAITGRPEGMTEQAVRDAFDQLPRRFSSDDVRQVFADSGFKATYGDRVARDWRNATARIDQTARDEVRRVFFSGDMTNLDQLASRVVVFHYWMSRATPLYIDAMLHNPGMLRAYAEMMQSSADSTKGFPDSVKNFYKFMLTPFGYNLFLRPDAFFQVMLPFWNESGYAPDGENWLGKHVRTNTLFLNPLLDAVLNFSGAEGDTFAPDPLMLGQWTRLVTTGLDFAKSKGWISGTGPTGDAYAQMTTWLRAKTSGVAPGTTTIPDRDQRVYARRQINQLIIDVAKEQGLAPDDPVVLGAMDDPSSALYQTAFDRYANQKALDQGLRTFPLTAVTYPKSRPASPDERANVIATAPKNSPEQQAAYDVRDVTNITDPRSRALNAQDTAFKALGTPQQRTAYSTYYAIKNGDLKTPVLIGGQQLTPEIAATMDQTQLDQAARTWVVENNAAQDIVSLQSSRDAFLAANPDEAAYKDWAKQVRDYPGGAEAWWRDTAVANPNAARYLATVPAADPSRDFKLTGINGYLAYSGIPASYRDYTPAPTRDPSKVPYNAATEGPLAAPQSGGGDSQTFPVNEQTITRDIQVYQRKVAAYNAQVGAVMGQPGFDIDQVNPMARSAIVSNFRDQYGLDLPTMGSAGAGYVKWAQVQAKQGAPTDIASYLAWRDQMRANDLGAAPPVLDPATLAAVGS